MKKLFAVMLASILCACGCAAVCEDTGSDASASSELTADGYVLVCTSTESRWFPLADEETGEYSFTVRQSSGDQEMNNTIVITTEGVYIKEADCDNQDCVGEGLVTLENKADRVLGNMIVCLPHSLTVELYSREEVEAMVNPSDSDTEETGDTGTAADDTAGTEETR